MNYIVFDLEFNMFFKFHEGDLPNPDLKNEIIQIGAVILNEKLETIGRFDQIIKPVLYKRMNPYVKRKTNIDTKRVSKGTPFIEVIKGFSHWVGPDTVLCSWGHDDIMALKQNCGFFGFAGLSFDRFINVQQLYMNFGKLSMQPGLENAVEVLDIEKDSLFHDAFSDANYTAEIFRKVFDPTTDLIANWERDQEVNKLKIEELHADLNKADIKCPECGGVVKKDGEVIKTRKYFAFGVCVKCNIQVKHTSRITNKNNEYFIVVDNKKQSDGEETE